MTLTCNGQEIKQENFLLTVSPIIDKTDQTNKAIIETLHDFLKTKNSSLTENKYWIQADFQRFIYPYLDIYNIEHSKIRKGILQAHLAGNNCYRKNE